jgi:hypothetical protein
MTRANRISNVISILIVALLVLLVIQSFMFRAAATQTVLLGVLAGLMAVVVMQSARWASDNSVEYKTVPVGAINESTLQECGKEGWRLVCVDTSGAGYIFTR